MASFFRKLALSMSPAASPLEDSAVTPSVLPKDTDLNLSSEELSDNLKEKESLSPVTESTSPKSNEFISSSEGLKSAVDRISTDSNTLDDTTAGGTSEELPLEDTAQPKTETKTETETKLETKTETKTSDPVLQKKNEELADAACKLIVEIADGETGWEVWENKNGIKIEKSNGPEGSVVGRSTYTWIPNTHEVSPYDLSFVEDCLWDVNAKKEYDDQAIEMLLLKEFENDYHVVYQAFKGRFGVPGRDFIITLHKMIEETETGKRMIIGAQSTAEEDQIKIENEVESIEIKEKYEHCKKTLVRGHARVAGFVVDWTKSTNEFKLHYVNDADLKTKGIPAWLVTRAKLDQLRVLDKIRIMIDKKRKIQMEEENLAEKKRIEEINK